MLHLDETRHTYASFAIAAGLNAKTLSTYMGHATIAITLDLYGHLFPGAEIEATGLLDAYFARQVRGTVAADCRAPRAGGGVEPNRTRVPHLGFSALPYGTPPARVG